MLNTIALFYNIQSNVKVESNFVLRVDNVKSILMLGENDIRIVFGRC